MTYQEHRSYYLIDKRLKPIKISDPIRNETSDIVCSWNWLNMNSVLSHYVLMKRQEPNLFADARKKERAREKEDCFQLCWKGRDSSTHDLSSLAPTELHININTKSLKATCTHPASNELCWKLECSCSYVSRPERNVMFCVFEVDIFFYKY